MKMMNSLIALLFLCMGVNLMAQEPTKEQIKQVEEARKMVKGMKGEPFPDFSLSTIEGQTFTSEDTKGKYVLFNFWFTRCRPCIEELPELNALVEEFAANDEVIFLAPTFDDEALIQKFLTRFEFDYQLVGDVKDFCLELNIRSYPTHFIVNREGIIEKVLIGYSPITVSTLRKSLNKLLRSE